MITTKVDLNKYMLKDFRAKREQLTRFQRLLPESQGQHLALTVLCVPCPLDKSTECAVVCRSSSHGARPVHLIITMILNSDQ